VSRDGGGVTGCSLRASPFGRVEGCGRRSVSVAMWMAGLCLLSGCETFGSRLKATDTVPSIPATYHHQLKQSSVVRASLGSAGDQGASVCADAQCEPAWWRQYGSDELNSLVERALSSNPDLKIAALRINQARIRADQAKAGKLPTLTAPMRTGFSNAGGVSDAQQSSQIALTGSWKWDVWGEQRGVIESADFQVWRTIHERENVQRLTLAGLVSSYIAYLAANDAIELAGQQDAIGRALLQTIERRAALGDATAEELEQQRAAIHQQAAALASLHRQREAVAIQIARLLGTVPGRLSLSNKGLDELRQPRVQAGLPSSLLLRRPDIRMMEARMRAADADIDVARARLLPPIELSAQAGFSGLTLAQLLQPQSLVLNTLASLAVTIFDGGRRAGNEAFARSYHEEMVETYGQTVLQAIREVEAALSSLQLAQDQLDAQKLAARSALNRFRIANEAFAAGAIELTALLDIKRAYQRSLDDLQRLKGDVLGAFVSLSMALGDGAERQAMATVAGSG
jgi:multidrug efflux system outer membrane protein